MNRLLVIALAILLVGAFAVPAMAVDNEFGGYWRTRMYRMTDFSGDDSGAMDNQQADTRTRLYYTAVLSDEVKLVNKFEMDAVFGDSVRGDIGSDGQNFEIKQSYADFNLGDINVKLGTQGKCWARGFLFCDDFTGAIVRYVGDDMIIPFIWIKAYEGGMGDDANDRDYDFYGVDPSFTVGDMKLNPFLMYVTSAGNTELDGSTWRGWDQLVGLDSVSVTYLGVSADYSADMLSAWFTGIYSFGTVDVQDDYQGEFVGTSTTPGLGTDSYDVAAYLVAAGVTVNLDAVSVHAQAFYATGDDDGLDDDESSEFYVPKGQSYYWAEIMGYGTIDAAVSNGSPGDQIGNIMAFNVGVEIPMDKLSLTVDIWNASLAEDNANGDTDLGTEVDLAASYQLLDDLKLDVVAAYLSAGDATGDENPMELGAQFSLSF